MAQLKFAGAAIAAALMLAGCGSQPDNSAPATDAAGHLEQREFELTPAVISMRWQLLNPEVNSFTLRDTNRYMEYRVVPHSGPVWDLPTASGFTMPQVTFDGATRDYETFAEDTFTNAMLVLKDGQIVFENYRNRMLPENRHAAFSMSKTITAMLVGLALDKGEIASLDDPAEKYVPQLAGTGYEGVSIRQILQMRSGVDYEERYDFGQNPSMAARLHEQAIILNQMRFADGALETKNAVPPGSKFNYSTLDTMVLGWLLEQATGMTIEQQTRDRIWGPLGAQSDGFWMADGPVGEGRALNGMGFNATLRDYARLGLLMASDGMRGDTRILPEGWVAQMTEMTPIPPEDNARRREGYGFQTWQIDDEPGAYSFVGLAGQYIYVHPQSGTVIVKLSYYPPVEPEHVTPETVAMFKAIADTPAP